MREGDRRGKRNFSDGRLSLSQRPSAELAMEASALTHTVSAPHALLGRTPLLRLQGDEKLVAMSPARPSRRLRRAGPPLPGSPAVLLPTHARVDRGRRGRAPGGLRLGLQRDAGRRPPDQRTALALPHRAQPLAQPPAPPPARRPGLDGRLRARGRRDDRRCRAPARGLPPPGRRRPGPARDAEDRAAHARDRRTQLRADRRGDGDDRAEREVAARARARRPGRGGGGAAALLRGRPAEPGRVPPRGSARSPHPSAGT